MGILVSDLRGNAFSFSPLRIMFTMCLSYMSFIILRYDPSMSAFGKSSFYDKWVLNFVKNFLWIYWDDYMVFIIWYITLIDSFILKNPCISMIKLIWSWCVILFVCSWILLELCWGFFHLCSSVILAWNFLSFFLSFFGMFAYFWYQGDGGLIEWVEEFSFLCNFPEEFEQCKC